MKKVLHLVSHPADAVSERVQELTARVSGPLTRAIRSEQDAMLEETLDELDEAHREVLLLRNFAGLAWAEVAERLGRESEAAAARLLELREMYPDAK